MLIGVAMRVRAHARMFGETIVKKLEKKMRWACTKNKAGMAHKQLIGCSRMCGVVGKCLGSARRTLDLLSACLLNDHHRSIG